MVAIITGTGNGLERSSLALLGAAGKIGNAEFGRGGQNVYVNAATGTLNIQRGDEFLVGRGPDADLATEFSTGSAYWHTPNWRAVYGLTGTANTAGSTITRLTAFYDFITYTYDAARGAYVNKEGGGAHDEVRFANGVWSFTEGNSRKIEYYEQTWGGTFLVSRIVDADGNTQSYTYDSTGVCIARITNADGSFVEMTNSNYRPNEIKTSYINASGGVSTMTRVRYNWDPTAMARLLSLTVDLTPEDNSVTDGNIYRIEYGYSGSTQRLTSITQTDGSRLDIAYYSDGRVQSLTETAATGVTRVASLSYDTVNRITTVTDATGQVTQLWYDAQQRLTKIVLPPAATGAAAQIQLFAYDADGNVTTVTDPSGNATTFQYDSNGNEIWRKDSLGNVVTRTYGSKNELLSETRHEGGALSFTTSGSTPAVTGNKVVGVAYGSWGNATTQQSYTGSAFVSARRLHPYNGYTFLGLTDGTLSATAPYSDYDYSYYFHEDSIRIWENGAHIDVVVPSGASDNLLCEIEYDGAKVVYRVGGTVVREVATSAGRTFRAGVSTQHPDRGMQDITFAARAPETTRFIYDAESHLRYRINPEGEVAEYRYTAAGELEYQIDYPDHVFAGAGTGSGTPVAGASFETPEIGNGYQYGAAIAGMTFAGYSGITGNGSAFGFVAAADGDQVAFLQGLPAGGGSIAQALSGLSVGAQYSVKFLIAARPATGGAPVTVSFNGTVIGTFTPDSIAFQECSATFTATGSTGTVTFSTPAAAGDHSSAIDKVRIAALPMIARASFEAPEIGAGYQYNPSLAGMTFSPGSGIAGNGSAWGFAAAPDGDQLAYIQTLPGSAGSIAQSLTGLVAGNLYTVKFLIAARPATGGTPVTVSYNGTSLGTFDPASSAFQEIVVSFIATGPTGTLSFAGAPTAADRATAIDNLRISGAGSALSEADLDIWRNSLADRSSTRITYNTYDVRGNLASVTRYGTATAAGGTSTADGYSRTVYVHDQAGQLLSRVTEGQLAETFVYDGLGRVVAATDRNQGTTNIVFNDAATQTVITLASGLVTTSTYNKAGDLVSVAESGSYVPSGMSTNKYDKLGRLRMTTDAAGFNKYFVYDKAGRMVAEINHRGDMVEYRYDSNDRLIVTRRYTAGVSAANLAALANPDSTLEVADFRPAWHNWDIWTWRTYDKEGRLTSTIDGTVRTYEYDSAGRLVKTIAYYNAISWDQALIFQANPPTTPFIPVADARDTVARNFYDKAGQLIAALDAEGYLTRNIYDRAGRLVERIAYFTASAAADRTGPLSRLLANQVSHANDRRAHFVYDGQGQLRYEIDALNQVTEYRYNSAGQATSTIRHAGSIPVPADYRLATIQPLVATLSASASAASSRRTWSVYDEAGRLAYTIGGEGAVTRFSYDTMGQVTKSVEFAVVRATTSAPELVTMNNWAAGQSGNAGNRVTRHYYSARGELRYMVDGEGYVSRTDFDAAGRTVGEFRWTDPFAITDSSTIDNIAAATNNSTRWVGKWFGYDFGEALTDFTDGESNWTRYDYYQNGTQMREFLPYGDGAITYFWYDFFGRLATRLEANGTPEGATVNYGRDGLGNLNTFIDARTYTATRTFDHLGLVRTETDAANGVVSYEYNAFGNVTKVTDARNNATVSTYDNLGRLLTTTDALNNVTTYSYNEFGDLRTVTRGTAVTTFDYDRAGRVIKTTDAEGHFEEYTLDAFGNRINVRNKIGGNVVNSYDRRGLLVAETLPMASVDANGNTVAATVTNKFEYDGRRNLTKKIEAFGLGEMRTTIYYYDKADRLVETGGDYVLAIDQATHNAQTWVIPSEKLKYDQRGRVIERTDALGSRTLYYYDRMNRVSVEIDAAGTYTAFTYDANGNVLTRRIYGTAVALPATAGGSPPAAPGGEYRETSYSYDVLNRLKTTSVAGLRIGAWNGSSYASTSSATVTVTLDYDANGNVVRSVDGNNNASFAYYDKENRKIAEVDREGYLTFYTLDGEGNVTQEDRYATAVAGAAIASDPNALRAAAAAAGPVRTTLFEYDRNGRRRFERRTGVEAYTLNVDGTLSGPATATASIEYTYNGLGEVTRKIEANGDTIDYDYDSAGRLTRERRAAYFDQNGAPVRPTLSYSYNGLNALTRTRQGGETAASGDRITRYAYGAGGRLATMTDANNASYEYHYDAAGNVLRENYTRYRASGSSTLDALLYTRDQLGRVTSQVLASWNGSGWDKPETHKTAYNAYGDVAQRGVNELWQEQFTYDAAGRLTKSNSGDGVWRFFVYDGAGNRTLTLESEGTDLTTWSLDSAMSATTQGNAYVNGITATIGVFDRRGQQVAARLPWRELTVSTVDTLTSARTVNAYGEVTSETDTRGGTTYFTYNAMGRLTQKQSPSVSFTTEGGQTYSGPPVEKYYYDIAGRMIGTRDANAVYENNSNPNHKAVTRALLAGTGHGGSEAVVTYEYHPDGGYLRDAYDVFGDKRKSWDEISRLTEMSYDAMGRLTQMQRPNGLIEYYAYDLLGQRTKHWNSLLGSSNVEVTDYDMQGRVVSQTAFGGDVTATSYTWSAAISTSGFGSFGGWIETTTMANGRSSTEKSDLFGHQVYKSDLGGNVYTFSYDQAGRMTQRAGGETVNFTWFNTGRLAESFTATGTPGAGPWSRKGTTYGYDKAGNLLSERLVDEGYSYYPWSRVYKNATATYDALGRLSTWTEAGGTDMAAAATSYQYDLVGNIRHTHATYRLIDYNGVQSVWDTDQDIWYRYDSLNRLVTKGELYAGQIVRGLAGADYLYNAAGQRLRVTRTAEAWATVSNPAYDPNDRENAREEFITVSYAQDTREEYAYDLGGALWTVRIAQGGYVDNLDGSATGTAAPAYAALKAVYTNDLMGRVTNQVDYQGDGTSAAYDRTSEYNAKGQVWHEVVIQRQGNDTLKTDTTNQFGSGSTYALGAVTSSTTYNYKLISGSYSLQSTSTGQTSYVWYDGAVQSVVSTTNTVQPSTSTNFSYDGSGTLISIYVSDGVRPRSVAFVNDANGQAIRRDETDGNYNQYTGGDPHDMWHRFGGKQMGHVGNNGTLDTDYATSIANRATAPSPGQGAFRFGQYVGATQSDFDLSGEAITSYGQGVAAGGYTVRQGDTLETIAAQLWGDSSLWYKLAEVNGMSASNGLVEGQRLVIPAGVMRTHHNASTFKPYDPAETLGDLTPATPQPKAGKRGKCGVFGQLLLIAVAVAVSVVTAGALSGMSPILIGAISGAAGSIASQAVGLATGIQEKFSFKGVALAALGGAVGGAIGPKGLFGADGAFGGVKSSFLQGALRGAAGSALTQGIGVAVGLQKKFDFAGVAAAGVGGGITASLAKTPLAKDNSLANHLTHAGAAGASAIGNAAVRSLINGTNFGDNLIAALPDVIGSTIGNMVGFGVSGAAGGAAAHEALHETAAAVAALGPRSRPSLSGAELPAAASDIAGLLAGLPGVDLSSDAGGYLLTPGTSSSPGATSDQTHDVGDIVVTGPRRRRGVPLNVGPTLEKSISTGPYRTETRLFPNAAQARFRKFAQARPGLTGGQALTFVLGLAKEFGIDAKLGGLAEWSAWAKTHRRGTADYTLRYEIQVENSLYSQLTGSFLTSSVGTATLHYLNDGSAGLLSLLDREGALDLTARQNPRAAQVGANIGLVAAVVQGGVGLSSAAGRRSGTTVLRTSASISTSSSRLRAISAGAAELSPRQASVLEQLGGYGSRTIVPKRGFGQSDLAALGAATGDEFAMFTIGGRRLLVRGDSGGVPISLLDGSAEALASKGWRWSSHVHSDGTVISSAGDRAVLSLFGNPRSAILTPSGPRGLFNSQGDLLGPGWLPRGN
jgi:YD repeat-containing protein